jgi:hypothetical protein
VRKRKLGVRVLVLGAVLAVGLGAFQGVGALTSALSPKPKLETNLAEPGREAYQCSAFSAVGNSCDIPAGKRLVIRSVEFSSQGVAGGVLFHVFTQLQGGNFATHNFIAAQPDGQTPTSEIGSTNEIMYSDTSVGIATTSPTWSATVIGDLLDCNRLLTATITVDCNATGVTAHA